MASAVRALWFGAVMAFVTGPAHAELQLAIVTAAARPEGVAVPSSRHPAAELWHVDAQGTRTGVQPLSPALTTPLGSLWKLFVYDYLVSNAVPDTPYTCVGQNKEEVYCCEPGQQIMRDEALVNSCGLYFAPARWGITQKAWGDYWKPMQAPDWLQALHRIEPATEVSVQSLLNALRVLSAQTQARQVLLDRLLLERSPGAAQRGETPSALVATMGSRLRAKSWSWHAPQDASQRVGGFAGWLADGTPLWARGEGTSDRVLARYAAALEHVLPRVTPTDAQPCVEVRLFDRYPIKSLETEAGIPVQSSGMLDGPYRVRFVNGNDIMIKSQRDVYWLASPSKTAMTGTLMARLSREEYVARVIDREASSEPIEAARALAVAARSYLLQNASRKGQCLQMKDSSHHQRVAPRPASAAARAIAEWSAELILAGAPVTYHQTEGGHNQLSWQNAREQATQGWRYDTILAFAFPRANLARWGNPKVSCQALPEAEQWLHKQRVNWRIQLDTVPGYQEPHQFGVCRLQAGNPYVDRQRRQIYVRGLRTLQDRLDLTHEYLHLAFEAHPSGQDEHFIEALTRRLLLE